MDALPPYDAMKEVGIIPLWRPAPGMKTPSDSFADLLEILEKLDCTNGFIEKGDLSKVPRRKLLLEIENSFGREQIIDAYKIPDQLSIIFDSPAGYRNFKKAIWFRIKAILEWNTVETAWEDQKTKIDRLEAELFGEELFL